MCGGGDAALRFAIPYAEYPAGKWAWRKDLVAHQIGRVEVATCDPCRWAYFRGQQIVTSALLVGFILLLAYFDPGTRALGWWLVLVALLPIALIAGLPLYPRGKEELRRELFRRRKQHLAIAHGTTPERLRPILG
jgi:hypothetical protein